MANKEPSGHRKLAIKRADGEPLTRQDLQYDLLTYIFEDKQAVFRKPFLGPNEERWRKYTFRDVYVSTLASSSRSSKAHRDKLLESPEFGTDFAKISLLANVGRINTTMAFFPEMRTTLRTYHPVPALQKTEGSLQDAPRIKNILKACLLPKEVQAPPSTPSDVLRIGETFSLPTTSVVNLLFILSNHSVAVGRAHFQDDLEFIDLFTPINIPSKVRAQAFLWTCWHYLESASREYNPFMDEHAIMTGKAPLMDRVSDEVMAKENVDPIDEIEWGKAKTLERKAFLQKEKTDTTAQTKTNQEKEQSQRDQESTPGPSEKPTRKTRATKEKLAADANAKKGAAAVVPATRGRQNREALQHKTSHQRLLPDNSIQTAAGDPYPHLPPLRPVSNSTTDNRNKATRGRKSKAPREVLPPEHYEEAYAPEPERTMFEHAWHLVSTTDPLADSDDDNADGHVRLDYVRRLKTLTRLRGKSPTPVPSIVPQGAMDVDNHGW